MSRPARESSQQRLSADRLAEQLASQLESYSRSGEGWTARCPAHPDKNPSLSIYPDKKHNRVIVVCHRGCPLSDVLAALEITQDDLNCSLVAVYPYHDAEGTLLYEKCRFEPKRFVLRRPDGKGGYVYKLNGTQRVLYRLHELKKRKKRETVFLVEGEKDADNLVAQGLCATTAPLGAGKKWDHTFNDSLADADIVILPDNDPAGRRYAVDAATALVSAAKRVRVLSIPGLADKEDVSDWLKSGGTKEALLKLVEACPDWSPKDESDTKLNDRKEEPYFIQNDGMYWSKTTREGRVAVKLSNFVATITEEITLDDGSSTTRDLRVVSPQFGTIDVPARSFHSLNWTMEHYGVRAIIEPDHQVRTRFAAAIQSLSQNAVQHTVFLHTGWTQMGKDWVYLHAKGGLGKDGPVSNIETRLGGSLRSFDLPAVVDVAAAVRASLKLLQVAPLRLTYPILASIYRAVLAEVLPVSTSLFLVGETGTKKSAISGIAQAHWGSAFADGKHFTANWSGTANSLEGTAYFAKDALSVIDDFAPRGTTYDVQSLHKTADRVLRGQGNLAGRSRMNADTSLRREMSPRGMIMASGEDIPSGKSLRARLVILEFNRTDVDNTILSELQQAGREGRLAQSLSAYIIWQAGRLDDLRITLPARLGTLRAIPSGGHARTPENAAHLMIGLEQFFAFAVHVGALTESERAAHLQAAAVVFAENGKIQDLHQRDEDPVAVFRELFDGVLASGRGHLADASKNRVPVDPQRFGWRLHPYGAGDAATEEWLARGECLGWVKGDDMYVNPEVAYSAVQKLAREQGRSLPVQSQTLWKLIHERHLLVTVSGDRHRARVVCGGQQRRVIHLSADRVLGKKVESTDTASPAEHEAREISTGERGEGNEF